MENFESQGYAIIDNVLSASECEALATNLESSQVGGAGSRRLLTAQWCRKLATFLKQHAQIAPHLPESAVAVQCTLFDKSPEKNWLVALHQDLAIPVCERVESAECSGWSQKEGLLFVQPPIEVLAGLVAVRVHLDDCGANNGPIRVVPGSHQQGRLSAEQAHSLREQQAESLREERGEVACLGMRGSVVLMRPLLLHASSKAQEIASRRVLHFLFGPASLPCGLQWHEAV